MFEKRPIWGLIVGLNVCVLIWLISVQETVIFDNNNAVLSSASSSSSSNNYITNTNTASEQEVVSSPVAAALQQAQQHGKYDWDRDLLSNHLTLQKHDYDDNLPSSAVSTLTTLNLNNNNYKHNNNSRNNKSNKISKQNTFLHNFNDVKTTTKTSDLSSNIQKLTSSLGTGVLKLKTQPTASWAKLTAVDSALPAKDFEQLIDLKNFQFLLPQPVCGNHIAALIIVHSAPKNHEKRLVIRETWGSITHHTAETPLRVLFLLGAVKSEKLQADLQNENNIYRDIVQGSFIDDYRNMTYKHVMAFKWFLYNCPQAQIMIKIDDDIYLNTPLLIKYLQYQPQHQNRQQDIMNNTYNENPTTIASNMMAATKITTLNTNTTSSTQKNFFSIFKNLKIFATSPSTSPLPTQTPASSSLPTFNVSKIVFNHPKNLLFCEKIIGALVKRSYRSKWRASFKEYSERFYPPYCPGYAIIYSPDVIYRLYTAAQNSKYFWIDDVHITGVLAQQTNTTITTSSHYVLYSDKCDEILTGKTDLSKMEFLFGCHSITAEKLKYLWHLQMMSLPTLEQLHNNKNTMNDDDNDGDNVIINEMTRQHHYDLKRRTKNDGEYSSSYSYTSANGFR